MLKRFLSVILVIMLVSNVFGQLPDTRPLQLAVSVGVESYPNLANHEQLEGCINDTKIIGMMLTQRFGFEQANVVTLTNEAATGEAIRNQFSRLIAAVESLPPDAEPAQVVFHFSGHGSQVNDQPSGEADCDEIDGLDETLVPYDASRQGGPEDIRDDEIYTFIEKLCAGSRAKIWLLLDCCHSGTAARGATRFRSLTRGKAISIVMAPEVNRQIRSKRLPEGAVILSACRANEKEPEYHDGLEHYGLLSRFVSETLNSEQTVSKLSYDDLRESLIVRYRRAGVTLAPTPQLEGDVDSFVLAAGDRNDRPPYFKISAQQNDRSVVTLHAGLMHGVSVGSLYEVFESPDQIAKQFDKNESIRTTVSVETSTLRFWLKITNADGITSSAKVFQWTDDGEIETALPRSLNQAYAIERRHDFGTSTLRVRVVAAADNQQDETPWPPGDPSVMEAIRDVLVQGRRDNRESSWLQWTQPDEPCDVLVRVSNQQAAVFPGTGNSTGVISRIASDDEFPNPLTGGWGPIELTSRSAATDLLDILVQVNRVRNLLRVASLSSGRSSTGPQIKLELVEIDVDDKFNITADRPWPITEDENGNRSLLMRDGDLYSVRVTNLDPANTGRTVHVTVLHADANMGVDVLLPYQMGATEEQAIPAGKSQRSQAFQCNAPGDIPIHGLRTAFAFATIEPNNFEVLATPTLPAMRSSSQSTNSPLHEILAELTYFQPRQQMLTRGEVKKLRVGPEGDESWASSTITWFVEPLTTNSP